MRLLTLGFILFAANAGMPSAFAQANSGNSAPPPPRLEKLEEGTAPASDLPNNAPQVQPDSISQKRAAGGKVIETHVRSGGSNYYVLPNDQSGTATTGDMQGRATRPAQWEILHFDFRNDKDKQKAAEAATRTPAPPPMPAPGQ